jgi:hypothetical protein
MTIPQWILDLADLPAVHRLQHLESNADEVKDGTYYKNFDDDEMEQLRIANAQTDIEIRQKEDELQKLIAPIRKRLKELKTSRKGGKKGTAYCTFSSKTAPLTNSTRTQPS